MVHDTFRLTICGVLLVLAACAPQPVPTPTSPLGSSSAGQPQPSRVEEITFESGPFHVVGDLRLPGGTGPFPVVLFVHGSSPTDRMGKLGMYLPIMERMLEAGYATFSWDKPGTGESTGQMDGYRVIEQRAQILLDAIEVMKAHPDINAGQIGLWGISEAGYVMPHALSLSEDIAFMICVSCPGMAGYDLMAFQVTALALCDGVPDDKADQKTRLLTELDRARTYETYEEYLHYREILAALAGLTAVSLDAYPVLSEQTWQENPSVNSGTWNPIKVIEQNRIPVLAIFGDRDRQLDPLQGAYAYRKALGQAGSPESRVELFPTANHGIWVAKTGCTDEYNQIQEQYVKTLGYGSLDEALEAVRKDPYRPGLMSRFPFAPGYLDTMEEWLRGLRDSR